MAKQKGIIKLKGTIGDITFYKTQDGNLAREKGGIDPKRIANDPAFQRTRENGEEFGRAGKAGKLLRTAIRVLLLTASDNRVVSRLTKQMLNVIKADLVSTRGQRNVLDGETVLLEGFEFNIRGALTTTLFAPFVATINRVTGELKVNFASFVPQTLVVAPPGTTHFKIVSAGAEIDFEAETFVAADSASATMPWDTTATAVIDHTNAVTANSTKPLFLFVGIEFFQEVNGQMYSLRNGAFNPLSIVKVDGGV